MIAQHVLDEHFPDRPTGYFDHAAVGTVPASVADAIADVARALTRGMLGSAAWHERTDDALELLSKDFGVPAERLTVLANTSTAMNIAARSIHLQDKSRVVTFADDFPSPRMPWPGISAAQVTELEPGQNRTETILAAIDDSVDVVSITHVHATTGEVTDLARVYEACSKAGALLLVDGTQGAGLLTGGAQHADVYVGASYKWLLAGFGTAVVSVSKRFEETSEPIFRGYMNPTPSTRLEVGHTPLFNLAALQQAALVRQEIGLELIRNHTISAVERIAAAATELGIPPTPNSRGAGIVSLSVSDAVGLQRQLADDGITAAVREGYLRISPHLTTTEADVDCLLSSLKKAVRNYRTEKGA